MKEFIEIPFGAKDSELRGWEYTIPKGYTASIENGKIIVKKEESEDEKDEKIRMALIHYFSHPENTSFEYWEAIPKSEAIAWLEKQGKSKFEQCIQKGDKIVSNEDGTHFNISQLERVVNKVTKSKETAKEFLKSAEIMDENDKLADEYKLEKQEEQNHTWSEEDETALCDALWCCKQAASIAKDENDMGNIWYVEKWLKTLKERLKGE